ncbi:MAG: hypothetical protein AB8B62_19210 [Roseobacter sp.]
MRSIDLFHATVRHEMAVGHHNEALQQRDAKFLIIKSNRATKTLPNVVVLGTIVLSFSGFCGAFGCVRPKEQTQACGSFFQHVLI